MNEKDKFWKNKLIALLHDPINKAFDVSRHEKVATEYLEILGIPNFNRGDEDRIASSMDRMPLPGEKDVTKQIKVEFQELTGFIHPFTGEILEKPIAHLRNVRESAAVSYTHLTLPTKA